MCAVRARHWGFRPGLVPFEHEIADLRIGQLRAAPRTRRALKPVHIARDLQPLLTSTPNNHAAPPATTSGGIHAESKAWAKRRTSRYCPRKLSGFSAGAMISMSRSQSMIVSTRRAASASSASKLVYTTMLSDIAVRRYAVGGRPRSSRFVRPSLRAATVRRSCAWRP